MTGGQVWSERYDGQLKDVFDLQDEITRNVVASIQTTVHLSAIEEPVERGARPDLTVWELTMRAWHLLYDFTPKSFDTAKALLERALALDPEILLLDEPTSSLDPEVGRQIEDLIIELASNYTIVMGYILAVKSLSWRILVFRWIMVRLSIKPLIDSVFDRVS